METRLEEDIGERILAKLRILEIIINKLKSGEHEKELPTALISRIRPA